MEVQEFTPYVYQTWNGDEASPVFNIHALMNKTGATFLQSSNAHHEENVYGMTYNYYLGNGVAEVVSSQNSLQFSSLEIAHQHYYEVIVNFYDRIYDPADDSPPTSSKKSRVRLADAEIGDVELLLPSTSEG